jgi:hypothetical protein
MEQDACNAINDAVMDYSTDAAAAAAAAALIALPQPAPAMGEPAARGKLNSLSRDT